MAIRLLLAVAVVFACASSAWAQRSSSRRTSAVETARSTITNSTQSSPAVSFAPPTFLPPVTSPLANPDDWAGGVKAEIGEVETVDGRPLRVCGWTQGSYTASTDQVSQLPMGFNYKANQFLLQQNWLQIDRAAKAEDAVSPTVGFRSDTILPGSDYLFTLDRGLFDQQLTAHHGMPDLYGIDPVQLYVETYHPNVAEGMTLTVGRFYAPFGIETVDCAGQCAALAQLYVHLRPLHADRRHERREVQFRLVGPGRDGDRQRHFLLVGRRAHVQRQYPLGSARGQKLPPVCHDPRRSHYSSRSFNNLNLFEITYKHRFNDRLKYSFAGTFAYQDQVPDVGLATWFGIQQYWTWQLGRCGRNHPTGIVQRRPRRANRIRRTLRLADFRRVDPTHRHVEDSARIALRLQRLLAAIRKQARLVSRRFGLHLDLVAADSALQTLDLEVRRVDAAAGSVAGTWAIVAVLAQRRGRGNCSSAKKRRCLA